MTRRAGEACQCWDGQVTLHAGHCCIHDAPDDVVTFEGLPCGHGDDAKARDAARKNHEMKEQDR